MEKNTIRRHRMRGGGKLCAEQALAAAQKDAPTKTNNTKFTTTKLEKRGKHTLPERHKIT